jgi:hypothetical protein
MEVVSVQVRHDGVNRVTADLDRSAPRCRKRKEEGHAERDHNDQIGRYEGRPQPAAGADHAGVHDESQPGDDDEDGVEVRYRMAGSGKTQPTFAGQTVQIGEEFRALVAPTDERAARARTVRSMVARALSVTGSSPFAASLPCHS